MQKYVISVEASSLNYILGLIRGLCVSCADLLFGLVTWVWLFKINDVAS